MREEEKRRGGKMEEGSEGKEKKRIEETVGKGGRRERGEKEEVRGPPICYILMYMYICT